MKNKMMMLVAAALLTIAGLAYGFSSSTKTCPLEGTPACPKVNCPLAGAPECPYDKATTTELPACCQKK